MWHMHTYYYIHTIHINQIPQQLSHITRRPAPRMAANRLGDREGSQTRTVSLFTHKRQGVPAGCHAQPIPEHPTPSLPLLLSQSTVAYRPVGQSTKHDSYLRQWGVAIVLKAGHLDGLCTILTKLWRPSETRLPWWCAKHSCSSQDDTVEQTNLSSRLHITEAENSIRAIYIRYMLSTKDHKLSHGITQLQMYTCIPVTV